MNTTPQPPAPTKNVNPDDLARANRRILRFGALMILTLLLQGLDLPWRMLTVPVGVTAAILGIFAVISAWRAGARGLTIPAGIAGIVMCAFMSLSTLLMLFVWQIELDHQTCVNNAITRTAQAECEQNYRDSLERWRNNLVPTTAPTP